MKRILFIMALAFAFAACNKEEILGQIEIDTDVIEVPSEAGSLNVMLDATTEWRLEIPSKYSWVTTDLHGGKPNRKYFTVSFTDNPYTSERFCDMKIYTTDRNDVKELRIIQLPKRFNISFARNRLTVRQNAGEYSVPFRTNLENSALTVTTDSENWISLQQPEASDTSLVFYIDPLPEVVPEVRNGHIYMSYTDEYDRYIADTLLIRQLAAYEDRAKELTFKEAEDLAKSVEEVEDNYVVEGFVTAYGDAENYCASMYEPNISGYRYILENADHKTVIFESEDKVNVERGRKVRLCLLGLKPVKYNEGSFSYHVFTGVRSDDVIRTDEDGVFEPRRMKIEDLTYSDVFTLVTLEDVEIATLNGAFTNFKESSPNGVTATSDTHTLYWDYAGGAINWMKSFPEYYRFYPTPVLSKGGETIYMYVSPEVSWAHEKYPQNSGSITGIVVRENFSNFDIKESAFGIRPLCREDIKLDQERFTKTLVNFEFDFGEKNSSYVHKDGDYVKFLPHIQQETSQTPCTFTRKGATKVAASHGNDVANLGFQDKFRGYTANRRDKGMVVWSPANTIATFLVENLCTEGIEGSMTLTIETNANKSNPGNPVRARVYYSLDGGNVWNIIDNSEVKFLSQFDRADKGETGNREATHVTGMKMYSVALPQEILGKESVSLKIEQTDPKNFGKTLRIGSLTIKYNK